MTRDQEFVAQLAKCVINYFYSSASVNNITGVTKKEECQMWSKHRKLHLFWGWTHFNAKLVRWSHSFKNQLYRSSSIFFHNSPVWPTSDQLRSYICTMKLKLLECKAYNKMVNTHTENCKNLIVYCFLLQTSINSSITGTWLLALLCIIHILLFKSSGTYFTGSLPHSNRLQNHQCDS